MSKMLDNRILPFLTVLFIILVSIISFYNYTLIEKNIYNNNL